MKDDMKPILIQEHGTREIANLNKNKDENDNDADCITTVARTYNTC